MSILQVALAPSTVVVGVDPGKVMNRVCGLGRDRGAVRPRPTLLWDRGVETVIGVVIGLAVGCLTRRPAPAPTEGALR